AEDGIRDRNVTGVQTCAHPIFVTSSSCCRAVPPISSLFPAVGSCSGFIVRRWIMITITPVIGATVRRGVGIIVLTVTVWLPPIATPIGEDRSRGCAQNECA